MAAGAGAGGGGRARAGVVGGGVGGLAVGGRLARAGLDVAVLEKNPRAGGRAQGRAEAAPGLGDFRFDTGPSLLLMRRAYEEAFAALGSRELPFELLRVDPAYRVFFADGSSLDLTSDVREMTRQLDRVEPGAGLAFVEWLAKAKAMFDIGGEFIETDARTPMDLAKVDVAAALLSRVPPWELVLPHDSMLKLYFKDPRLRALLTFQDLYVGLSPYSAPGVFSLLAGTEIADGVWYPRGGFGAVRDGLRDAACANGADVRTGAHVRRVTVAGGRATGVELENGEFVAADVVVTNADVPYAYDDLLEGPRAAETARELSEKSFSAGVVSFNWSVKGRLTKILHHSVFLSDDPKQAWDRAASAGDLAEGGRCPRPNFYVHAPARSDPSCAPNGCDSIMVLLPVGNAQDVAGNGAAAADLDWAPLVASGREAVLRRLEEAGVRVAPPGGGAESSIREAIASEFVYTPKDWEHLYNVKYGAAFGLAHGLSQISYFRPDNGPRGDEEPDGLYFVGASTRPGNGVPLVLTGAKITSERILGDLGITSGPVH